MKESSTRAKGVSKKEIRSKIQDSVNLVIGELKIVKPSKKVKKEILKASKKIAGKINIDLKKVVKKTKKAKSTKGLNGQKVETGNIA